MSGSSLNCFIVIVFSNSLNPVKWDCLNFFLFRLTVKVDVPFMVEKPRQQEFERADHVSSTARSKEGGPTHN